MFVNHFWSGYVGYLAALQGQVTAGKGPPILDFSKIKEVGGGILTILRKQRVYALAWE